MSHLKAIAQAIDHEQLRAQKMSLLAALDGLPYSVEHLQGLLHLVDAIQDAIVDDGLASIETVFAEGAAE